MTRTIDMEDQRARNMYERMLRTSITAHLPERYTGDILIDFETITEHRLYEQGNRFLWLLRENGCEMYFANTWPNYEACRYWVNGGRVKRAYLVYAGENNTEMVEILPEPLNILSAFQTLAKP